MPESTPKYTVAIFNASDDTVEMLSVLLAQRGCICIPGEVDEIKAGKIDFIAFLEKHRPDGMIWDIAPPYDRNWHFFKMVRNLRALDNCAIVLTTTHLQHLNGLVGQDSGALELVGKPYDLDAITDAVVRAIEQRGQARPRVLRHDS
jgi:two-component SAPR family response regulator